MNYLNFVSLEEIQRIKKSIKDSFKKAAVLADIFRINTLYMIEKAGSGHIGSSFSSMDIVTWLWLHEMISPNELIKKHSDIYFSSKGHDVPALYNVLIGTGRLDFDYIHKLRRLGGLPGHPDIVTPYIMTNTGPLGMGVSKAMGMAIALRAEVQSSKLKVKNLPRIFVMCSDGELQEGSFWESLQPAANGSFGEIIVIVDHNKIQSDTWVRETSDLGDLGAKFKAFGWEVERCNGHNFEALSKTFAHFRKIKSKPKILIADTVKGKGVSFMEKVADDGYYKFHSGALSIKNYHLAFKDLSERVNKRLNDLGVQPLKYEHVEPEVKIIPENPQRLVAAYSDELVKIARRRKDIVAMDADLVLDTGLIPFKNEFGNRYIECGIAEQHMVSLAGGLALSGKLPIVHSFACFLSTRPNEQIYNNATEKTKIIYVGSLAGLLPGGPGHSHQSVREISTLGSIPGLTMIEPSCEQETRMALRWAVNDNRESTYIRLVSIPVETPFELPKNYQLKPGRGVEIVKGGNAAIIAYGAVMLTEAVKAAQELLTRGVSVAVINLPWLNRVDEKWLSTLTKYKTIISIDDHYVDLGQGTLIAAMVAKNKLDFKVVSLGITSIPECGQNQEVLRHHQLDSVSLAKRVRRSL
ncbi:transketolase [Candidatus Curtissbacteria bacterium RIFCSPHIGHO2_01_FULL_41_13]|uniref:Transketolase n=1 Tax=Candidatus Curtissbacteria bacterium RIFCSPHIGHO2_01_FULL_41_13 TaxID=1797745 RepID=A0A1F5G025_9BACT|nr:MAG: transketolase [Candidatus Curtissbacteria bacterium RIFCSPHIGHO2_01_FULL_41_13]